MIKQCYQFLHESKQQPATQLNALKVLSSILQTNKVECVNLFEVFILPLVYEIAIQKHQDKERGAKYFTSTAKGVRSPEIEKCGIHFMRLCEQLLFAGSTIKVKRAFLNKELKQSSQFVSYFQSFSKYQINEAPTQIESLRLINVHSLREGRSKYLKNLSNFNKESQTYSQFFITKIIESLQSPTNPLFNAGQDSKELDFRKLLKSGDIYLVSPLIQQLILRVKLSESFSVKKNCLSLLSDFVKWGDIQALIKVGNDDMLETVGTRIAEVQGNKGLFEGEKIYPEVKGQMDTKRKFYLEYLKSLQSWSKCLEFSKFEFEGKTKILSLYNFLKKDKRFEFPQNLMIKKIESQFVQNLNFNAERNQNLQKNLSEVKSSVLSKGHSLNGLNRDIQNCVEEFTVFADRKEEVHIHMQNLIKHKNNFNYRIDHLDDINGMKQEQMETAIQNALQMCTNIQNLQNIFQKYQNGQIDFRELSRQHGLMVKQYLGSQFSQSQKNSVTQKYKINAFDGEDVRNSFIPNESNIFKKQPQPQFILNQNQFQKVQSPQSGGMFILGGSGFQGQTEPKSAFFGKQNSYNKVEPARVQAQNFATQEIFGETVNYKPNSLIQQREQFPMSNQNSSINTSKSKKQREKFDSISSSGFGQKSNSSVYSSANNHAQENKSNKSKKSKISKISSNKSSVAGEAKDIVPNETFKNTASPQRVQYYEYIAPPSLRLQKQNPAVPNPNQNYYPVATNGLQTHTFQNSQSIKETSIIHNQKLSEISKTSDKIIKNDGQRVDYQMNDREPKSNNNELKVNNYGLLKQSGSQLSNGSRGGETKFSVSQQTKQNNHYFINDQKKSKMAYKIGSSSRIQSRFQTDFDQDDLIREPECRPLDNSYYGIQQIQSKVKRSLKPEFKDCFQISKEVIPSSRRYLEVSPEYGLLRKQKSQSSSHDKHQEYLISKLRTSNSKQKNSEIRSMKNKVLQIKSQNLRLRSQASDKENSYVSGFNSSSRSNASSSSSSRIVSFSNTKSNLPSLMAGQKSNRSANASGISSIIAEGIMIEERNYGNIFEDLCDEKTRKACVRNKSLLLQNDYCEIGTLAKKINDELKMTVYFTPKFQITNFTYSISNEPNLQIESYCKASPRVPTNKQIKIQVSLYLKAFPYSLPIMAIQFDQDREHKSYSFHLPVSINKFVHYQLAPTKQILDIFTNNPAHIKRTKQFRLKQSVMKTNRVLEYFPNLSKFQEHTNIIYGGRCILGKQSLILLMTTKGKDKIVLQAMPEGECRFIDYLLVCLQNILQG